MQDSGGNTPAHVAGQRGHLVLLAWLLKVGVDEGVKESVEWGTGCGGAQGQD